jgi:hypothetical protein
LPARADDVARNARRGEVEMPEPEMSSVTVWLGLLKEGDPESAAKLWQRYFEALVKLARKRLRGAARTVADEEDGCWLSSPIAKPWTRPSTSGGRSEAAARFVACPRVSRGILGSAICDTSPERNLRLSSPPWSPTSAASCWPG